MNTINKSKKINDITIKPVVTKSGYNVNNVRAFNWFAEPYSNILLCARKKSGKSNVIYRCLENCVTKGTNVMVFSSSCNTDDVYKKMKSMLEKKKCNVSFKTHFIENNVNLIKEFLHVNEAKDFDDEKPSIQFNNDNNYKTFNSINIHGSGKKINKNYEKSKDDKKNDNLLTPETIFVFDDLSSLMRDNWISRLLTRNRHVKSKVFISAHGVHNLEPLAREMIDVFILFPNIPKDKLEYLSDECGLSFKNDTKKEKGLIKLYDYCTQKPYNFLYIDKGNMNYRKNFNEELDISAL